jgi:hypothetical protein
MIASSPSKGHCDSHHPRRKRYNPSHIAQIAHQIPTSAVCKAMSARPLRAPWIEIKDSKTENLLRNEDQIDRSIIPPDGFADLPAIAPRPGIHHQINRIDRILLIIFHEAIKCNLRHFLRSAGSNVNHLIEKLTQSDNSPLQRTLDLFHLLARFGNNIPLFLANNDLISTNGESHLHRRVKPDPTSAPLPSGRQFHRFLSSDRPMPPCQRQNQETEATVVLMI